MLTIVFVQGKVLAFVFVQGKVLHLQEARASLQSPVISLVIKLAQVSSKIP
jgi:hypothetical protein